MEEKLTSDIIEYIDGSKLSLVEFLETLLSKDSDKLFPNNCFPSKEMGDLFISNIKEVSEASIKNILRKFLVQNSTYGSDDTYSDLLWNKIKSQKVDIAKVLESERGRRLLYLKADKDFLVWEGITWILDLLPNQPKLALQVLSAYLSTHFWNLPDYAISGLLDSMAIIRAKYVDYKHRKEIFLEMNPLDFEKLVAKLYESLDYEVELTKASYDEGIDVIAKRNKLAQKQTLLIQCKRTERRKVNVGEVTHLLGVVSNKKSTKGVFVCSTDFTSEAEKFALKNPSIELINGNELILLLNENFGVHWIHKIDEMINLINKNNNEG